MLPTLLCSPNQPYFPFTAVAIAANTGAAELQFTEAISGIELRLDGEIITKEEEIVNVLAKKSGLSGDNPKERSFLELAKSLRAGTAFSDLASALDSLDDHLAFRTFLVGHSITVADWSVWGASKGNVKFLGLIKNNRHPHVLRWFSHINSLKRTQKALAEIAAAKAHKIRSNKLAAGFALGLQDAVHGQVVTRFPPEPSGYLHLGHTKAAILNQYFAKMYDGKLIIRFDDTNPTKERAEFEETILDDLKLLNIHGDSVTHTSDHFHTLHDLAIQLLKSGKAYADDTNQQLMRDQRFTGVASIRRDVPPDENLKRFEEMKAGAEEGLRWCIRAKISVDDPNKALRDPVIYRCNLLPHHRTGNIWKIYPTYDFACPVVDSLEGVSHALRTNEYRDRNAQYEWMVEALGLRKVKIWDFSRLNFTYTLLSKRKLHEFVDKKLVRGWDDPRFPTVRGILRRGMSVEALTQFMLSQGPSQSLVTLEWDSIWAINKKLIDPVAPRLWAILKNNSVPVTIKGGPNSPEVKSLPRHKKNAEIGFKKTLYSSLILVEQEDAASFDDQEEITLMDWGNAIVRSRTIDTSGQVTAIEMELNLEGDFRKTKKKITWLSQATNTHFLLQVALLDYDYLITKRKLEENDALADFITPVTEFRQLAFSDPNVNDLRKGETIQFERKGYYIYDGEVDGVKEFILIPDGRAASVASKASVGPVPLKETDSSNTIPNISKMYDVEAIYEKRGLQDIDDGMYKIENMYNC